MFLFNIKGNFMNYNRVLIFAIISIIPFLSNAFPNRALVKSDRVVRETIKTTREIINSIPARIQTPDYDDLLLLDKATNIAEKATLIAAFTALPTASSINIFIKPLGLSNFTKLTIFSIGTATFVIGFQKTKRAITQIRNAYNLPPQKPVTERA